MDGAPGSAPRDLAGPVARRGAGGEMVLGVRLSGEDKDYTENELGQMLEICSALDSEPDLDYFNITVGTSAGLAGSTHIVPPMEYETGYTAPISASIKSVVTKPIFVAPKGPINGNPDKVTAALAAIKATISESFS